MLTLPPYYRKAESVTTAQAFVLFRQTRVDLEPNEVKRARASRDYLQCQITKLRNDDDFPPVTGQYMSFGSFARSTKVRPLDDIDMLSLLNGYGTQAEQVWFEQYTYNLRISDTTAPLAPYANEEGLVNSTRILNRFKNGLQRIPNYQKAAIKRTGVAAVLNLLSYPWVFDIVPSVPIADRNGDTLYYLIPNGSGKWMRTDPRRDQTAISEANQRQNNNLIPLIRLIKYWNSYSRAAPKLGSYHLETLLINGLGNCYPPLSSVLRTNVSLAFDTLANQILVACPYN